MAENSKIEWTDPEGAGSVLRIYGHRGGHQWVLPSSR